MILLIDNYDSFSYNVFQLVGSVTEDMKVIRNDELTIEEIKALEPDAVILSPGPGRPENAGVCEDVVKEINVPILGICLGHQAICEALGGKVTYAKQLMHGKQSVAEVDNESLLFKGLDKNITVGRYHSLCADGDTLPACLKVTARTADGEIMAVEHTQKPIYGLQFHPESVLTPNGLEIIKNFLNGVIK
ncbi:MAG: aminodeoxychorismate/anthranilate synthase component II [Firmicutes bacterium]|nr:aminodeoxychorismate/anthranilate synthase component II [Bacillota bacterium]MBQ9603840.1 aminodeoxychorismate/anthranilate synthase component II [Bacillota bacterium]